MRPTQSTNSLRESNKLFEKKANNLQDSFIKELRKYVQKMDTKRGRLENNTQNRKFVTDLLREVERINKRIGLDNAIQGLFADFDTINENLTKTHKELSNLRLQASFLDEYKAFGIETLTFKMQGQGMNAGFVQPIRENLYRQVLVGGDIVQTIETLEEQLGGVDGGKGQFERYFTQVSRDSLFQYSGTVNQGIANRYDLDGVLYVGSLVEDSRPQCERWVDKSPFPIADLVEEIAWAERNGSGMIPGTTEENFFELRGGYNCRHEAFPIRL